jgi:hypothetical protein
MGERERREISVWTLKRRERRASPTGYAARNYFTFSTTSISTGEIGWRNFFIQNDILVRLRPHTETWRMESD